MNNITVSDQTESPVTNANIALFNPQYLTAISNFAQVMASGVATVPNHLRNNPADCMAIAMQAAQWQMNPFAVAQKTFTVSGVLGYEAQLVNAVISTRGPLVDRINYDWFGPWEKVIGKFDIRKNEKGQEYRTPGWKLVDEEGIGIRVWATLKGEEEPRELILLLAQARTRNSTLWADDPRQQLAYLAVKRWARLYCPEVILGVYTVDELEERSEKVVNPASKPARMSASQMADRQPEPQQETTAPPVVTDDLISDFRTAIEEATTVEMITKTRAEIEEFKTKIGIDAFTELRGKVVKRHRQILPLVEARAMLSNCKSLEDFQAAEAFINRTDRNLRADDFEKLQVILDDLRPEFQN